MIPLSLFEATFASTTGVEPSDIAAFVMNVIHTFIGLGIYFIGENAQHIVAWTMIFLVISFVYGVIKFFKFG